MRGFIRTRLKILERLPWLRPPRVMAYLGVAIPTLILAFLLGSKPSTTFAELVYATEGQLSSSEAADTVHFQSSSKLLSDGQFVWGPNVGNFDIERFLQSINSALAPYADDIEGWARYYTINPKVLLAVLQLNHALVLDLDTNLSQEDIRQMIEATSQDLSLAFYEHLYSLGERGQGRMRAFVVGGQSFKFEDGTQADLTWSPSSASYAVEVLKAKGLENKPSNLPAQALGGTEDFESTFGYFFPDTDPLDSSNNLEPGTLPPDDYFQFPFPLDATWTFSGAHSWAGGGSYPDRSSMDFSISWSNYPGAPYKNTVAAAPGDAVVITPHSGNAPCWVEIDHGGGWTTHYYHLVNLGNSGAVGPMGRNQLIGGIGEEICNGGFATGPHVHFALFYNGAPYDLEGLKLSGWTIHEGPRDQDPYGTGYIERDGVTQTPWT